VANPRVDDLRKRLEKEPGSRLFAQLAEELRKEGDLAEAIRVCREGLQKVPNYPSAHMTLGRALFDNGDLAAARAEFDAVLKGAPDNILASRLLGECLERLGDAAGALARYRTTLALAPADRQVTAKIQALEQGATARIAVPAAFSSEATVIMSSPVVTPPPAARQTWPPTAEATLPPMAGGVVAAPPQPAAVVSEPETPAVPGADGSSEALELEQPYDAPTLVGVSAAYGVMTPGPPRSDVERFERYAPPSTEAQPAPSPGDSPASQEAPSGPAPEVNYDFEAGTAEPVETWQAPPATFTPEFVESPTEPEREPAPPATNVSSAAELEMSTATLAELYLSQGVLDKAIEVYRQLLEREPGNERARTRLTEIQTLDRQLREEEARAAVEGAPASSPGASRRQAIERTIERLETLLAALKGNP
jgi:tetratricopeptide (TPR) repeat protein